MNSILYRFQDNFKFYTILGKNLVKIFEIEENPAYSQKPPPSEGPKGEVGKEAPEKLPESPMVRSSDPRNPSPESTSMRSTRI